MHGQAPAGALVRAAASQEAPREPSSGPTCAGNADGTGTGWEWQAINVDDGDEYASGWLGGFRGALGVRYRGARHFLARLDLVTTAGRVRSTLADGGSTPRVFGAFADPAVGFTAGHFFLDIGLRLGALVAFREPFLIFGAYAGFGGRFGPSNRLELRIQGGGAAHEPGLASMTFSAYFF